MYNINNFCRVCFKRKPQPEMLSVNRTQIEQLLFIGDSNKIIRINGHSPKLCIECGTHLDSVYDFIQKLRMNTLDGKRQELTKNDNLPNHFIESEKKSLPSQSHELTLPYESTVENVVVHCKTEPNIEEFELPFQSTVPNVVIHCKIEPDPEEYDTAQPQSQPMASQSNCTVESVLYPEPIVSRLSVKSFTDLNTSLQSKSTEISGLTVESVDYSKQKPQLGDDFKDLISFNEPTKTNDELNSSLISTETLNLTLESVDCSNETLQSGRGSSGSFSSTQPKSIADLKPKSLKMQIETVESMDATYKCPLCGATSGSTSKMLRHVHEYSGPGFACPVEKCNFIFSHKLNFDKHMKSHPVVDPCSEVYLNAPVPTASEIDG